MLLETVRISQSAKDQLVKLKRTTGIENWNVLCRWAFCESIAEPTIPTNKKIQLDSNVEMSWKVFGGQFGDLYMVILRQRCINDKLGTDPETLTQQFRLHLHRGIAYLATNKKIKCVEDLVAKFREDK